MDLVMEVAITNLKDKGIPISEENAWKFVEWLEKKAKGKVRSHEVIDGVIRMVLNEKLAKKFFEIIAKEISRVSDLV